MVIDGDDRLLWTRFLLPHQQQLERKFIVIVFLRYFTKDHQIHIQTSVLLMHIHI